jgi:hypothetical protein
LPLQVRNRTAGLKRFDSGDAGVEFVVREPSSAEHFAEEVGGGTIALAGVAVETARDDVAEGIVAAITDRHDVVERGGFGTKVL